MSSTPDAPPGGAFDEQGAAAVKAALVGAGSPQEGELLFEVERLDLQEEWGKWCAEIGIDLDMRHFV